MLASGPSLELSLEIKPGRGRRRRLRAAWDVSGLSTSSVETQPQTGAQAPARFVVVMRARMPPRRGRARSARAVLPPPPGRWRDAVLLEKSGAS